MRSTCQIAYRGPAGLHQERCKIRTVFTRGGTVFTRGACRARPSPENARESREYGILCASQAKRRRTLLAA